MILREDVIRLVHVGYQVKSAQQSLLILKDINLHIKTGMSIAISGASGSGKTSLLNLMAGLELPTSGQIFYGTQDITQLDEDGRARLRARRIGFIFQSFQLLNNLTALENVLLPLEINGIDSPKALAMHWLEKVGLQQRVNHYPLQLSGGEQQRVAIARAFVISPQLLFADEPTGNLDVETGRTIADLLFELNQSQQTTLVIVTHDEALAKRCAVQLPLINGQLVC
jgi:putative ABC transport system ATP-binding protein